MVFKPSTEFYAQLAPVRADATNTDYSNSITSHKEALATLKSAPFLNDLRDHYAGEGIYEGDEDLIDRLYSDQAWRTFNTISAVKQAVVTQYTTSEERQRLARIEKVFRMLPNPWDEGGRGWGEASADVALPVITDPTNLLGGASALGKGMLAAKLAREASLASGVAVKAKAAGEGAWAAAKVEGGISAGQEVAMDASEQYRDMELGLQGNEYDLGRTAGQGAIGGVFGGAVGGVIGALAAVVGIKRAKSAFANARASGLTDGQITELGVDGLKRFSRLDEGVAQSTGRIVNLSPEENVKYGLSPDGSLAEGWESYNPNYQSKAPSKFMGDDGEMKTRGEPDPDAEAAKEQILDDATNEAATKGKDGADKTGWHKDAAAKAAALQKIMLRRRAGKEITEGEEAALNKIKANDELPDVRDSFDDKGNYKTAEESTAPTDKTAKTKPATGDKTPEDKGSDATVEDLWAGELEEKAGDIYTTIQGDQANKTTGVKNTPEYDERIATERKDFSEYVKGILADNPDNAEGILTKIRESWGKEPSIEKNILVGLLPKATKAKPKPAPTVVKTDVINDLSPRLTPYAKKELVAAFKEEEFSEQDLIAFFNEEGEELPLEELFGKSKMTKAEAGLFRERSKEAVTPEAPATEPTGKYFTDEQLGQLWRKVKKGSGTKAGKGAADDTAGVFSRQKQANDAMAFAQTNDISFDQYMVAVASFPKTHEGRLGHGDAVNLESHALRMKKEGSFGSLTPAETVAATKQATLDLVINRSIDSMFNNDEDVRDILLMNDPDVAINKILAKMKEDDLFGELSGIEDNDIRSYLAKAFDAENDGTLSPVEYLDDAAELVAEDIRVTMDKVGLDYKDKQLTVEALTDILSDPEFKDGLQGFTPNEIARRVRGEVSSDVDFSKKKTIRPDYAAAKGIKAELNKTEMRSRNAIAVVMRKQHPDLSEGDAFVAATIQVLINRNSKELKGDIYSNTDMLERAAAFAVDRVKKDNPDYVPLVKLAKENFQSVSRTHQLPRMVATAQSLANMSNNKIKGVEPKSAYVSYVVTNPKGETVISKAGDNGLETVPKGSTVWVVGAQPNAADKFNVKGLSKKGVAYKSSGYGFRTEEDARIYFHKDSAPKKNYAAMVKEGEASLEAKAKRASEGVEGVLARLARAQKEGTLEAVIAATKQSASGKKVKTNIKTAKSIPVRQGTDLPIIKNKKTGEVRLLSQTQFDNGEDIGDLIGSSNINDWEIRYAPYDSWVSGQAERSAIFHSDDLSRAAIARLDQDRPRVGFESGKGWALNKAQSQAIEVAVPEEAYLAFDIGTKTNPRTIKNAYDLHKAITDTEAVAWDQLSRNDVTVEDFSKSLSVAYKTLSDAVGDHGGIAIRLSDASNLDATRDGLQKMLADFHPDTAKEAIEFIESVERTTGLAPVVRGIGVSKSASGDALGGSYVRRTGEINLLTDRKTTAGSATDPLETLFHETGHWAYHNVLTPEDRMEFWGAMSKYAADPDKIKAAIISANGAESPQELFANQFATWMMRQANPHTMEGRVAASVFDEFSGNKSYIAKVLSHVKAVIYKALFNVDIDPDLIPLFAKISSPDTRAVGGKSPKSRKWATKEAMGEETPTTELGKVIQRRYYYLNDLRSQIESLISNRMLERTMLGRADKNIVYEPTGDSSTDALIENTQLYLRELHSIFANSADINDKGFKKEYYTGVLSIMRGPNPQKTSLTGIAYQRMNDIYGALSGRPTSEHIPLEADKIAYDVARYQEGLTIVDPELVASRIEELWTYGDVGSKMQLTSLTGFTDVLERQYIQAWNANEHVRVTDASSPDHGKMRGQRFTTSLMEREARSKSREMIAKDNADALASKIKAGGKPTKGSSDTTEPESLVGLDFNGLIERYNKMLDDGHDTENIQATLMNHVRAMPFDNTAATKANADFAKGKLTKVPAQEGIGSQADLNKMRKGDLAERMDIAIRGINSAQKRLKSAKGDKQKATANTQLSHASNDLASVVFELQRRQFNSDLKSSFTNEKIPPSVSNQILTEIVEREGVIDGSGIPNGALPPIKLMLEKITHRDSTTQAVARTIAYRLTQMLNRTADAKVGTGKDYKFAGGISITKDHLRNMSGEFDLPIMTHRHREGVDIPIESKEFNVFRNKIRNLATSLSPNSTIPPQQIMDDTIDMVISSMEPTVLHELSTVERMRKDGQRFRTKDIRELVKQYMISQPDSYAVEQSIIDGGRTTTGSVDFTPPPTAVPFDRYGNPSGEGLPQIPTGLADDSVYFDGRVRSLVLDVFASTKLLLNGNTSRVDLKEMFPSLFTGDMLNGMMVPAPFLSGLRSADASNAAHLKHYFREMFGQMKRHSPERLANLKRYSSEWDNVSDAPVVWHFTPSSAPSMSGKARLKKPRPLTEGAELEIIRSRVVQQQDNGVLTERALVAINDLIGSLSHTRQQLQSHQGIYNKMMSAGSAHAAYPSSDLTRVADSVTELLRDENQIIKELTDYGVLPEIKTGAPVVTSITETADLRRSSRYSLGDSTEGVNGSFVFSFVRGLSDLADKNPEQFVSMELRERAAQDYWKELGDKSIDAPWLRGTDVLRATKTLIAKYAQSSQTDDVLHNVLERMGYDSIAMNNDVAPRWDMAHGFDSTDEMIVLDSGKIKLLNDPSFNEDQAGFPPEASHQIISAIVDDKAKAPAALASALQAHSTDPSLGSAAMSLLKGRNLNDRELATLHKWSPMQWFHSQSTWMKDQNFHWLGDWYSNHFPDLHQRFASKYYPLSDVLRSLPDSRGAFTGWMHKSNPLSKSKGTSQPKSHAKILRALRHGDASRQEQALTDAERTAYHAIREAFIAERDEMVAEGVFVGDRKNYVPQVWNKEAITSDRPKFAIAMMEYYKTEKIASGEDINLALLDQEALEFAQKLYFRLTKEEADGILLADKTSHTQSTMSDHIDYSRVIELEKHPELFEVFEPFLENDLESILVKYFEGTSRRITHIKKMGTSGHAFYDYMTVASDGAKGIAKLLSTDKVFDNLRTGLNENHQAELMSFVHTIPMPFANNQSAAMDFANGLVTQYQTDGIGGIRHALEEIGYRNQFDSAGRKRGELSLTYQRRVDAIVGAIQDFKGRPTQFNRDVTNKLNDSMKIVMKRPLSDNEALTKFSKRARAFNSLTLLSYVTLTSLGDPLIAAMRTGSVMHSLRALKNIIKNDGDYRAMVRNTGVAMENIVHERLMYMYGGSNGNVSNAFFNATLLTPWTDMNRQLAGATGYELFRAEQKRAARHYKVGVPLHMQSRKYKAAHRVMNNYGLGEWLPEGSKANESLDLSDLSKNEDVRIAIIKFTDDTIFQPNPNEVPIWAQTPVGAMIFQLKSFPVMMSRLATHAIDEARLQNYAPLMAVLSIGPAAGAVALTAKDHLQSRGGEDEKSAASRIRTTDKLEGILDYLGYDKYHHGDKHEFLGWYIESSMLMGGLGLLADLFHDAAVQKEHGAYGTLRTVSTILGPTVGTLADAVSAGYGASADAKTNAKDRSAARTVVGRAPFIGGNKYLKESIVDAWAGESESSEGLNSNLNSDINGDL